MTLRLKVMMFTWIAPWHSARTVPAINRNILHFKCTLHTNECKAENSSCRKKDFVHYLGILRKTRHCSFKSWTFEVKSVPSHYREWEKEESGINWISQQNKPIVSRKKGFNSNLDTLPLSTQEPKAQEEETQTNKQTSMQIQRLRVKPKKKKSLHIHLHFKTLASTIFPLLFCTKELFCTYHYSDVFGQVFGAAHQEIRKRCL